VPLVVPEGNEQNGTPLWVPCQARAWAQAAGIPPVFCSLSTTRAATVNTVGPEWQKYCL